MLKPKPSWLRAITPKGAWVTIFPHVYYPESVIDPTLKIYADIIVHENVHLRQQEEMGLEQWMLMYITNHKFRMEQECEATAHQIMSIPYQRWWLVEAMSRMLTTSTYMYASDDAEDCKALIQKHLDELGFVEPPPLPPLEYHPYKSSVTQESWWTDGWKWDGRTANISPLRTNEYRLPESDELPPWDYDIPGSRVDFEYFDRKGKF